MNSSYGLEFTVRILAMRYKDSEDPKEYYNAKEVVFTFLKNIIMDQKKEPFRAGMRLLSNHD